jgi:hypothetical protein
LQLGEVLRIVELGTRSLCLLHGQSTVLKY